MPLIKEINYYECLKKKPFVNGIDIAGLISSYAEKNRLLKRRLQDNVPFLESLRPTFQKALTELPKTWWNPYASDFLNSEEYQEQLNELGSLVYIRGEGDHLDRLSDYSLYIMHQKDIRNSLFRGLANGITIPLQLTLSPFILIGIYPQVYYHRKNARLTFEENPNLL
jgi:hypothetical protein